MLWYLKVLLAASQLAMTILSIGLVTMGAGPRAALMVVVHFILFFALASTVESGEAINDEKATSNSQ